MWPPCNTGARTVVLWLSKVLGGSKRRYAGVGGIVEGCSIKDAMLRDRSSKEADVYNAVVVRMLPRGFYRRPDGSRVKFDANAAGVAGAGKTGSAREPRMIFGPVTRELRAERVHEDRFSLAPEVL